MVANALLHIRGLPALGDIDARGTRGRAVAKICIGGMPLYFTLVAYVGVRCKAKIELHRQRRLMRHLSNGQVTVAKQAVPRHRADEARPRGAWLG
jgi:hypothetical protein